MQKRDPDEKGETLVCKSWFKMKKQLFPVNYAYAVAEVADDTITLNNTLSVPLQVIKNSFSHNYCKTCPGSNIDDAITIFDHKFAYANMRWLYTAVTRATDINKVSFYNYEES